MFYEPKQVLQWKKSESRDLIMAHIEATFARTGESPTVREICAATGLTSTDTVAGHIDMLIREGYLTKINRHGRIGRNLRLTRKRYFT